MRQSWAGVCDASPVSGVGVMRMELIAAPELRTSIVATPGITLGVRMVTKSLYGPAFTSSIYILAADVGVSRKGKRQGEKKREKRLPSTTLHLCTPRIQRPNERPIQVEIEA